MVDGGQVRGRRTVNGAVFLGIPYAAAPFGELSLAEPQPVPPWTGVRDALEYGPTCPQPVDESRPDNPVIPGDECLNVNVWTPDPLGSGLPVLVWIHGGGFVSGSNAIPYTDGTNFACDGVVTVAINYRLGAQGFGPAQGAPDNRGALDWLAALAWVRDNIATFGGDPQRVTVMGHEAGGGAVALLLGMPAAEGLFHQAIVLSGHAFLRPRHPAHPAGEVAPIVGGELIPASPVEAARAGAGRQIPLLIGVPTEHPLPPPGDPQDNRSLRELLAGLGLTDAGAERYRISFLGATPAEIAARAVGDRAVRVPLLDLAEARTAGQAPTHVFAFAARHGSPVPYAFDALDQPYAGLRTGPHPPLHLAEVLHSALVDFVAKGDPGWPGYDAANRPALVFDDPTCRLTLDPMRFERELWSS
ncbi:MAG TPA: carboxylesterase family protein [Micromonosporaceae bacterium]|nr:carboxylesterase family protein [Micromonosporaceae bacterium]